MVGWLSASTERNRNHWGSTQIAAPGTSSKSWVNLDFFPKVSCKNGTPRTPPAWAPSCEHSGHWNPSACYPAPTMEQAWPATSTLPLKLQSSKCTVTGLRCFPLASMWAVRIFNVRAFVFKTPDLRYNPHGPPTLCARGRGSQTSTAYLSRLNHFSSWTHFPAFLPDNTDRWQCQGNPENTDTPDSTTICTLLELGLLSIYLSIYLI